MQARRNLQAAIRHFRRSQEQRLAYRNNRKKFFSYVFKKCGNQTGPVRLSRSSLILTDSETAETLSREFAASFNTTCDQNYSHITIASSSEPQLSQFNCHVV